MSHSERKSRKTYSFFSVGVLSFGYASEKLRLRYDPGKLREGLLSAKRTDAFALEGGRNDAVTFSTL